jgi:flagellar hook-associated protein 1 FlgK
MRSTFLGLETARKGLTVSQKGLDVTGQNITNANTEGYTRQRIDVVSVSSNIDARYRTTQAGMSGQGVLVSDVSQIRNLQLDGRYRSELAEQHYYSKTRTILDDLEGVLNEMEGGIKPGLQDLVSSLQDFSMNPNQAVNANIVLSKAKSVIQMFNQYAEALNGLRAQSISDLSVDVNDVNTTLSKIQGLNDSISKAFLEGKQNSVNELMDQRNLLVDHLAQFGNIKVTAQSDGKIQIHMHDQLILDGDYRDQLNMLKPTEPLVLEWQSTGKPISLGAGSLKASIERIEGNNPFTQGIAYYQDQLNQLATSFAQVMNQAFTNSEGQFKALISGETASNLSIENTWLKNPSFILNNGNQSGSLDNRPILALIEKLEGKMVINGETSSMSEFVSKFVIDLGQDRNFIHSRLQTSTSIVNDLAQQRDSISAVSLDEEGANLLIYEKAFQANARVMNAMDEVLDTIINRMGLVGR